MNEVEAVALEPSPLVVEAMQRMFDRYSDTDEAFFDKLANTEHLMRVFTYVEAQAAIAALDAARGDRMARVVEWLRKENYRAFTDGMEAAAQICGSLAEVEYDDADGFDAATGC